MLVNPCGITELVDGQFWLARDVFITSNNLTDRKFSLHGISHITIPTQCKRDEIRRRFVQLKHGNVRSKTIRYIKNAYLKDVIKKGIANCSDFIADHRAESRTKTGKALDTRLCE